MANIRRLRKFSPLLLTYMVVAVDTTGKTVAASIITQTPGETFSSFGETVENEVKRLKEKYPDARITKAQHATLAQFHAHSPWTFMPKRL